MTSPAAHLAEVTRRLDALAPARLAEVARAFADRADRDGLHVVRPDEAGGFRSTPIPPLLTPVVPDPDAAPAARALLACVVRTARALLDGRPDPPRRFDLFAGFTPLERECVLRGWRDAERVAHARVDYLRDADGRLRALEVNATIPAMAGYSDIVARAWVREVAPALGAAPEAITAALARLPSNVDDLRRSLLAQAAETGAGRPGRWALLARANDPQDGELAWVAARFREAGLDPVRVTPEDFFANAPYDLVYRHLFARRLPEGHPLEPVFRDPRANALWNPVNAHLEVKGMLALVHEAAADADLARAWGHAEEDLAIARRVLPWTRLLQTGPTTGPEGERLASLPDWVAAHPALLILKRSWDYGGRSVFMAEDLESDRGTGRMQESTGRHFESWEALVRFAAADPQGDWIVQQRIHPARARHLRVVDGNPEWSELVTDLSAFTAHGAAFVPDGLTCRASASPIVNIVSGGGMAPILAPDVLDTLLA